MERLALADRPGRRLPLISTFDELPLPSGDVLAMQRSTAAIGSAAFFVAAPGTVVGLIPWLLTGWRYQEPWPAWAKVAGVLLICAGIVPLVDAFVRFVRAGGTPMPLAPTSRLVVRGFNRHVRNPMYVGVLTAIVGQALLLGRPSLLVYAAVVWAATATFVRLYEEPSLTRRFGVEYAVYRREVPAWLPRLRPWTSGRGDVPQPR
jgi:protein-S-isoprenylcysteine O-methyltransferase Ste14